MNPSNKVLASVAGVCITTAVVIGAVLGAQGPSRSPAQHPAGNPAPIASTVTVTSPASRAAVQVAAVSPSTTKAAAPVQHRQHRAVTNQGAPAVTDPTPQDPQPTDTATTPPTGTHGGPLRHGPTDAPSTSVDYAYPTESSSAQEQH